MKTVFMFKSMVTPKIVIFLYWISILLTFLYFFLSMRYSYLSPMRIIYDVAYLLAGLISCRIGCELILVIFKINENLQTLVDIKKNRKRS